MIENDDDFLATIAGISCVAEYTAAIKYIKQSFDIKPPEEMKWDLFFRGAADSSWDNIPSIYRNDGILVENEKKIYYEVLSRCSNDFQHCRSTFDYLVMMQHYGVPTRLLDLSTNPLVALFFACNEADIYKGKNGKVNIFNVQQNDIRLYDDNLVSLLANIAKIEKFNCLNLKLNQTIETILDPKFDSYYKLFISGYNLQEQSLAYSNNFIKIRKNLPFNNLFILLDYVKSSLKKSRESFDSFANASIPNFIPNEIKKNFEENALKFKIISTRTHDYINKIDELIEKIKKSPPNIEMDLHEIKAKMSEILSFITNEDQLFIAESLSYEASLEELTYTIREEKPYFNIDDIDLTALESVMCVKPKLDNPHIVRQSGAFFLFGLQPNSLNKDKPAEIPENFKFKIKGKEVAFIIRADKKSAILEELKLLSITEGDLFTDIDKVAKDIKRKYSPPLNINLMYGLNNIFPQYKGHIAQ